MTSWKPSFLLVNPIKFPFLLFISPCSHGFPMVFPSFSHFLFLSLDHMFMIQSPPLIIAQLGDNILPVASKSPNSSLRRVRNSSSWTFSMKLCSFLSFFFGFHGRCMADLLQIYWGISWFHGEFVGFGIFQHWC